MTSSPVSTLVKRLLILVAAVVCMSQASADLVGSYKADFSGARTARERGLLQSIFRDSVLTLSSDGDFAFNGLRQSGFWREHEGQLVLVLSGFFTTPYAVSRDELERTWPKNELEGYILKIQPNGDLKLSGFGVLRGPVLFRKLHRSTRELTRLANNMEMTPDSLAAMAELSEPSRVDDMVKIFTQEKLSSEEFIWLGVLIQEDTRPIHKIPLFNLFKRLSASSDRKDRHQARLVASALAPIADKAVARTLVSEAEKHFRLRSSAIKAVVVAELTDAAPVLTMWLSLSDQSEATSQTYPRYRAAAALGQLGIQQVRPQLAALAGDEDPVVRVGGLIGLMYLARDESEIRSGVRKLFSAIGTTEYHDEVILETMAERGGRYALPYLIMLLENETSDLRIEAAHHLGELGFPEAVPALLAIKSLGQDMKPLASSSEAQDVQASLKAWEIGVETAPLRSAAVEALWKIQNRSKRVH
jgi:HEAT repeat protein